jgi:penicillin-binding protein 2
MIDLELAKTFNRRSALFLGGAAVLTSVIVLRMLQLQVFQYKKYKSQSLNNAVRIQPIIPVRGKILTRDDKFIARDNPIYQIYIIPDEVKNLAETLEILGRHIKLSAKNLAKINRIVAVQRGFVPVMVKRDLPWPAFAAIQKLDLPGVYARGGFRRSYPFGEEYCHIAGYVGETENSRFWQSGVSGLEKIFNRQLGGTAGQSAVLVNAVGKISGADDNYFNPEIDGTDLKTTLHAPAQEKMYEMLAKFKPGAGVAIDIQTGEVLAICSTPGFDANKFYTDAGDEYLAKLQGDVMKPFINKAVDGMYPPGSTFKIAVALAALESGAVSPAEKIHCPGYWEYGGHRYHCWEKHGHGSVNMIDALAHSCDTYFYQIALRVGIDAIKSMALRLGMTEKFMPDIFPGQPAGVLPDKKWKESVIGQKWQHGDTIISGIGQGFVLTNPLQLCVMIARAVSDRAVVPKIIADGGTEKFGEIGLQQKNIRIVMDGLRRVVQTGGTAAGAGWVLGNMGGKTGTAQVRNISMAERDRGVLSNEQIDWARRNHGLFVGFAPADNPRFAVAVITEHSGGSGNAARTAAEVLKVLTK